MKESVDLAPFEGLIHSTAARYAPYLDDDLEDVKQVLRIKVWQALVAYDRRRVRVARSSEEERVQKFVFSCVRNRVKDLLKEQSRRNQRRGGGPLHVEDVMDEMGKFEGKYLSAEDSELALVGEDTYELPSTLSEEERALVGLLVMDYKRGEIALILRVDTRTVRELFASVQVKMSDWAPTGTQSQPALLAA